MVISHLSTIIPVLIHIKKLLKILQQLLAENTIPKLSFFLEIYLVSFCELSIYWIYYNEFPKDGPEIVWHYVKISVAASWKKYSVPKPPRKRGRNVHSTAKARQLLKLSCSRTDGGVNQSQFIFLWMINRVKRNYFRTQLQTILPFSSPYLSETVY